MQFANMVREKPAGRLEKLNIGTWYHCFNWLQTLAETQRMFLNSKYTCCDLRWQQQHKMLLITSDQDWQDASYLHVLKT